MPAPPIVLISLFSFVLVLAPSLGASRPAVSSRIHGAEDFESITFRDAAALAGERRLYRVHLTSPAGEYRGRLHYEAWSRDVFYRVVFFEPDGVLDEDAEPVMVEARLRLLQQEGWLEMRLEEAMQQMP